MDAKTLRETIDEAQRFLCVAKLLRETIIEERNVHRGKYLEMEQGTALCGSVRRASLDLTRSLARLRRYQP